MFPKPEEHPILFEEVYVKCEKKDFDKKKFLQEEELLSKLDLLE